MKNFAKGLLFILPLLVLFFQPTVAKADQIYCFCSVEASNLDVSQNAPDPECKQMTTPDCNGYAASLESTGKSGYTCTVNTDQKACKAEIENWKKQKAQIIADLAQSDKKEKAIAKSGSSQFLPACILADKLNLNSECGDVTIFIKLMLDIVNYLLSFVGGLALLFFIYGGFVLIFSSGAPDKITQGKEIL
ncbi:MAG: hypothetical protein NT034_01805, partial [Candidatus Magasanikbacteria bacterium]|nr:hypothetical protein [Candidatus Magasanikbacteria bacterium]